VPGFEAYANYFSRTATALNPCGPGQSPKLAGPGWGNVNTIDAGWMAMQAKAAGARCYMRELSVHVSGAPADDLLFCACAVLACIACRLDRSADNSANFKLL
jgi:hypothetical protein